MQLARVALERRATATASASLARLAWEIGGARGVRRARRRAVRAVPALRRPRGARSSLLGVCALLSQVGATQQFEPLLAAMAAGLVIENLAVAQGDALQDGGAARRAAGARGVLRRRRRVAAARRARRRSAWRRSALVGAFASALIRLGVAVGAARRRASTAQPARYAWTGLISQAGITLGFASVVAAEFPGWGTQVQTAAGRRSSPSTSWSGPLLFRHGLWRGRRARRAARRGRWSSCRIASRICTATTSDGSIVVHAGDRRRRRGARRADARTRRRVDRARRRRRRPRGRRCRRQGARCRPSSPSYQLRRLWLEEPTFSAYYGGFANEGLWPLCHLVDVRPQFRSEDWAAYQDVNEPLRRRRSTRSSATPTRRCSSRTTTSRWSRRRCARGGPTARTALFWHIPWPYPDRLRICPWRARDPRRACSPTTCSRFSWSAIAATSCWPSRRSSTPRSRRRRRACASTAARRTVVVGADRRRLRSHPGDRRRRRRSPPSSSGCATLLGLRRRRHRPGRRSARLHQGHSRAARRARRADHAAARAARPADVRADRRAVAIRARQLRRDRGRDRPAGRGAQRAPRACPGGAPLVALPHRRRSTRPAWSRSTASRTSASSARCTTA